MAKRKVGPVEVTADKIVVALIDRLVRTEARLASCERELNSHLEMIAEQWPKMMPDGRVSVSAMSAEKDSSDTFTAILAPAEPAKRNEG